MYTRHAKLAGQWRDCVLVERLLGEAAREALGLSASGCPGRSRTIQSGA